MVKLMNKLKKMTRLADYEFEFDTNKHHLTATYTGGALFNTEYSRFLNELGLFQASCYLPKGMELWLMFVIELHGWDLDDKKHTINDVKHTIAITIGDNH